jgi:hypothetical protein
MTKEYEKGFLQYQATGDLFNLTERLGEIDERQGLKFQLLLFIIEWCAERIIFPKEEK